MSGDSALTPGRALRHAGLTTRLLIAQVAVVVIGLLVVAAVALMAGPPLFREHLGRLSPAPGHGAGTAAGWIRHAEQAFQSANLLSLGLALPAALVAALAVSVLAARRIARPLAAVTGAADDVAAGRYAVRVPLGGMGPEFDRLAGAFNAMAATLQSTEETRRRLLSDLGHELRTPIATLDAYLEGMEDGVTRFDAETAALLREQTARLARLADDVSAVSRAEEHRLELRPALVGAGDLVGPPVDAARPHYAAKGVGLRTEVAAGCPEVSADRERIAQVLGNLLGNALAHTPPGGEVVVTARPAHDGLVITVSDTGEGIAAEHLPHVFERFYRADPARDRALGGSGIGLTIARALTEAHGGRLTAASPGPGHGATFTVSLPAVSPPAVSPLTAPAEHSEGEPGTPARQDHAT